MFLWVLIASQIVHESISPEMVKFSLDIQANHGTGKETFKLGYCRYFAN